MIKPGTRADIIQERYDLSRDDALMVTMDHSIKLSLKEKEKI